MTIQGTKLTLAMNLLFLILASFHIFLRKRCRWMFLQWFRHQERSLLPRVFLLFPLNYYHVLTLHLNVTYRSGTGVETATSSHIEEMIKELVQLEGLEVLTTDITSESTTAMTGKPSSQSSLPKDLPFSNPHLGKRIKIFHILSFSLLLLTLVL